MDALGRIPLTFEKNEGQEADAVKYTARDPGCSVYFTNSGFEFRISGERSTHDDLIRVEWLNTDPGSAISGMELVQTRSNFILGRDSSRWKTNVPHFAKLRHARVYPGVDVVYYGAGRQLEYDLVLEPEANARHVEMKITGARVAFHRNGDLVLRTRSGEVIQHRPVIYQEANGVRRKIEGRFALRGKNRVGFDVAPYDRSRPLIIDPVWSYNVFFPGAPAARASAIAVDAAGAVVLAGGIGGSGTASALATTPGAFQTGLWMGISHGFVMKLNPAGDTVVFATYIGGIGEDFVNAMAIDPAGNIYLAGTTRSGNFPVTSGALQTQFGGSIHFDSAVFLAKLAPAGDRLIYGTFIGGPGDTISSIAADATGSAYITGRTKSASYPATPGAFQTSKTANWQAFVSKLNPAGTALAYSTFLGGAGHSAGTSIKVNTAGEAYVAGYADGTDFPTTPNAVRLPVPLSSHGTHAFASKLNSAGSALIFSALIGARSDETASGIDLDANGYVYVVGTTGSGDFPFSTGAPSYPWAHKFIYVMKLDPDASRIVYLAGVGDDGNYIEITSSRIQIVVDRAGRSHLAGIVRSDRFPTTAGALIPTFPSYCCNHALGIYTVLNATGTAITYSTYYYSPNYMALTQNAAYLAGWADIPYDTHYPLLGKVSIGLPDLRVAVAHSGSFMQGQADAAYTITASNAAVDPTSGLVTVTENLPPGLNLVSMSGTGWSCPPGGSTCSRSDVLAGNASYPPITALVNVAWGASSPLVNSVSIGGGGDSRSASATDSTIVAPAPAALTVSKRHTGNFILGQSGAAYTITVSNALEAGATAGAVTVSEALPAGLTLASMTGAGWQCAAAACSRSDVLQAGLSYPAITVTVNVAPNAPALVTNQVSVSGGGSPAAQAGDATYITPAGCTYAVDPAGIAVRATGGAGTVNVIAPAGCPWTATSPAAWVTITSGSAGTGNGTVGYSVPANATALQRTTGVSITGQTLVVTQAAPVGTQTEAFVRQLYLDILNRTADSAGLSTWIDWIDSGRITRAQAASQFFQSAEFALSGSYISKLYLGIMLRDPDYGGWNGWFSYLRAGHSQTEILNQFLGSQEFQLRYGSLDNTAFVTLVYGNVLNRAPEPAGLAQWVAWLNSGTYSRAEVMNGFLTSPEFDARVRNRVYANLLYIGFLRRAGESAGLGGWTGWLNGGVYTLEQVVNGFITSPEYLARF